MRDLRRVRLVRRAWPTRRQLLLGPVPHRRVARAEIDIVSAHVPIAEEFAALAARVTELEARLAATLKQSDWLTIRAAATYLGRSEDAVYKIVERHGIDKHQEIKGGRIMLRRDELDAAVANHNPERPR